MRFQPVSFRLAVVAFVLVVAIALTSLFAQSDLYELDNDSRQWIDETLDSMTLDEKIGQLVLPSLRSVYTSSDSDVYDGLSGLVQQERVGGFHVFGGRQVVPDVLLNNVYSRTVLGRPLAAASILNRLQAESRIPLLITADFETGAGFRIAGATNFPRAMAFGAAGDSRLAFEAGRVTAIESRAIGVHVNFAPVVDLSLIHI